MITDLTAIFVCSMEEALRQQNINRLQKKQQSTADEPAGDLSAGPPERNTSSSSVCSMETSQPVVAAPVPDIELVFKPYPGQSGSGNTSDTRYIKTTVNATGQYLQYNRHVHVTSAYIFNTEVTLRQ